ncbi:MAG: chemotaxis protein CheC [Methanolinea sp.]|nr:chemotaxis protein CheC [Methanolinea sp.]
MNVGEESIDAIRELINIGVGRAAGLLNDMTGTHIRLHVPEVRVLRYSDLAGEQRLLDSAHLSAVTLRFAGSFSGMSMLIFPEKGAAVLIMALTGEEIDEPELDALRIETLNEVGNIVNNAVMGSITNVLGERLTYSMPEYREGRIEDILGRERSPGYDWVILAVSQFMIEDLRVVGTILMIFEIGALDTLIEKITAVMGSPP